MQFWNSWGVKSSAAKKRNSQCQSLVKRKGLVCLKVIQIKNNGRFLPLSPASFKKHPQTNSPAFLCQTRSVSEYTTHRCRHLEKQKSGAQHCWSQFSFKNLSWVWVARQGPTAAPALPRSSSGSLLCRLYGWPLCRPCGWLTDLQNFCSNFKCSAQNFLHELTSGFS